MSWRYSRSSDSSPLCIFRPFRVQSLLSEIPKGLPRSSASTARISLPLMGRHSRFLGLESLCRSLFIGIDPANGPAEVAPCEFPPDENLMPCFDPTDRCGSRSAAASWSPSMSPSKASCESARTRKIAHDVESHVHRPARRRDLRRTDGFLLTMKDRVRRRLARGERVNLLVRAYLGMGIWSLLLWCPTIFFLGIVLIILTH